MVLLSRYLRWRHGRGFGIHSPFAFRFITEVLRQRLPYYGYADIPADRRLRLLYRLVVFFRPVRVAVVSSAPEMLERTVRRASASVAISNADPDFGVFDAADIAVAQMAEAINSGGISALILNINDEEVNALTPLLRQGMTFANSRGTMVVANRGGLPRQDFKVKF